MSKFYRLALVVACCIIICLLLREPPCARLTSTRVKRRHENTVVISNNSVFAYSGYLDRRLNNSFIRIVALNRCKKRNEKFLGVKVNGQWLYMAPQPIEWGCPWSYAPGCGLVAHLHQVAVPANFSSREVTVKSSSGIHSFTLGEVLVEKEAGLTVCVPPIFWYTDWTKLILFVEYWRLQGATQFFFYQQSSSADVQKVFDFYGREDWFTVLPWPLLPKSDHLDPNSRVYRIGHSVAHNDCLLRARTTRAVLLDIDELIYSRKGSLLSMVDSFLNQTKVGGVLFDHFTLQYDPPLNLDPFRFEQVDYSGILKAKWAKVNGHGKKVVFRTDVVKRLGVHAVNEYLERGWKTAKANEKVGILLHNRYNHEEWTGNNTKLNFALIPGKQESFRQLLVNRTREIFPDGASFHASTQVALSACTDSWRQTQGNCKNPVAGCRDVMEPLEQWVERTEDLYTVF